MVGVIFNSTLATCVIDEGSEMNCLDESLALRAGVSFIPTSAKAKAAGSSSISLAGQTAHDFLISVQGVTDPVTWNLVRNLGVEILIGEPGKADNSIITLPKEKKLETINDTNEKIKIKYIIKKAQLSQLCCKCV